MPARSPSSFVHNELRPGCLAAASGKLDRGPEFPRRVGVEQDGIVPDGDDLTEDEDALGFKPVEVGQRHPAKS
jgi:hypothetical protein